MMIMLVEIVNSIFGDSDYGIYHRNGWSLMVLGYTSLYYINPVISLPVFAAAGYNFVQAMRSKDRFMNDIREERIRQHKSSYGDSTSP